VWAVKILDSEDEEDTSDPRHTTVEEQTCVATASTNPAANLPTPPRSERPSQDAWRSLTPEGSQDQSNSTSDTVRVKNETIDDIIKAEHEGEIDQFKRVALIKSEDGNFDIWNVDGFCLGPTVEVDAKYNRGFSRKVIGDVSTSFNTERFF
jgi:hypothetical protein